MDTQVLELTRPNKSVPWGFSIQGGKEFGCPLSVLRVTSGSIADQFGINVGDLLVKINLLPTDQMTHQQAITQIQKLEVVLEIRKGKVESEMPPPPPMNNANNSCQIFTSMGDLPPPPKVELSKSALVAPLPPANSFPPPPPPISEYNSNSVQRPLPFFKELQSTTLQKPTSFVKDSHPNTVQKPLPFLQELKSTTDKKLQDTCPESKNFGEKLFNLTAKIELDNSKSKNINPVITPSVKPVENLNIATKKVDLKQNAKQNAIPPVLDNNKVASASSLGNFVKNQLNNPDRDSKDLLVQQTNLEQNAAICFVCKDHIRGAYVEAKNKVYCTNHFCCSHCGQSIKGQFIESKEGKLYCMEDYKNHVAPKCNKCGNPVVESQIIALEKSWHKHCFVCEFCKQPISNGRFHVVENEGEMSICCEKDYKEQYEIMCSECNLAIENADKYVMVNGKPLHANCFKR